jgi:hypothetical protein
MGTPGARLHLWSDLEAGVVHGELRRRNRVLDEDVHILDVFFSNRSGSSAMTSPACGSRSDASNPVMVTMPLWPAQSAAGSFRCQSSDDTTIT